MMVDIRISEEDLRRLRDHLDRASPNEDGGFAVVNAVKLVKGYALTVRELLLPQPDDWMDRGEHWLSPTTTFVNRAVMRADALEGGLAFFHSHPHPDHPPDFSPIDRRSTTLLFQNLASLLPGSPLASLVFTPASFSGVALINLRERRVETMTRLGPRVIVDRAGDRDDERPQGVHRADVTHRQELAWGREAQDRLGHLRIAIVGAGGTGSAVLEQIARLGVKHVTIIDDDHIEPSNVTRVYGSTAKDADEKARKVDVAKRNYHAISPGAKVRAIHGSALEHAVINELASVDVVFGCTDTDSSRAQLNDLAYQAFVPVIDTGARVHVDGGALRGILGRVRYLRPGLPCLWCTGTIDGRRVLFETMSHEERAKLVASGYGAEMGPQPMVVQLTTAVASLAVQEFLRIFAHVGQPHEGEYLLVDLEASTLQKVSSSILPACRCQRTYGRGHVLAGTDEGEGTT